MDGSVTEGHCVSGKTVQNNWPSCVCSINNCNTYSRMETLTNGTKVGHVFPAKNALTVMSSVGRKLDSNGVGFFLVLLDLAYVTC